MSIMLCLALFMGVQAYPNTFTFEYRPELLAPSSHTFGYYSDRRHTGVVFIDNPLVSAHEAAHHLQHMNSIPYDEQQAWDASHYYLINCQKKLEDEHGKEMD